MKPGKYLSSHSLWRSPAGEMALAVVASTDAIVANAMRGDWLVVLDQCEQRRSLMDKIELSSSSPSERAKAHVLNAAVLESERAVAGIIAHALIDQQQYGYVSALVAHQIHV